MTKKTPTVVVTGANGFLGSQLVNHFTKKGWSVRALVREPKKFKATSKVAYAAYDLTKPVDDQLFKGADYLVHTAYMKYDTRHPTAYDINLKAAQDLLAVSRQHGLKKNLFMSTMSAHEDAVSIYGRQKLAIEKLFNTKQDVSFRSGLIMGDGGIVKTMSGFMKSKHLVPLIGGGKQPLQVIAVYDLVRAIESALTKPAVNGLLTVATPQVYTYKEFYQKLAAAIHAKVLFIPLPFWLLLGLMRLIKLLRLPLAVSEDNLWGLKMLRAVRTDKDLERLGLSLDDLETILAKSDAFSSK